MACLSQGSGQGIQVTRQGGLCLAGCVPPAAPARPDGLSSPLLKEKGGSPVPPAHGDSMREEKRKEPGEV